MVETPKALRLLAHTPGPSLLRSEHLSPEATTLPELLRGGLSRSCDGGSHPSGPGGTQARPAHQMLWLHRLHRQGSSLGDLGASSHGPS